jgi:uncharacterized protein with ParB-like and HNH nuclease domain
MNNQSLNELSVKEILTRYNVVVPEIQREYVWGFNDYKILESFFIDIKDGFRRYEKNIEDYKNNVGNCVNSLKGISEKNKNKISDALKKMNPDFLNIGFLYSYRPDYSIYEDINEDVYLIDGQQRFTTLFLLIFYFALKENESKVDTFKKTFRFNKKNSSIAFDYRVRYATHEFIIDLIENINSIQQLLDISNQKWFLAKYKVDITIKSIVGSTHKGFFRIAHSVFEQESGEYFHYLLNHIKFWHFKTEETSQGEELYITMNSRGQQLADNETIRAKIFESIEEEKDSLKWSEEWELWQDFFWKKRDKIDPKTTADKGFNEFLRWVQICEMIKAACEKNEVLEIINWTENSKFDIKYLKPDIIKEYFESLEYLYNEFKNNFSIEREYPDLDKKHIEDLLKTEWLSPKKNQISNIDCFRFLPILIYVKKNYPVIKAGMNKQNFFRFLKYVNNLARNENIVDKASEYLIDIIKLTYLLDGNDDVTEILKLNNISSTLMRDEEEKIKLELLRDSSNREKLEVLFWNAEDMQINKGEIAHIIDLSSKISHGVFSVDDFANVLDKYKECTKSKKDIQGDLIDTGVYKINNDRIIILDNWNKRKGFLDLLKDYIISNNNLSDFLVEKRKEFIKKYENEDNLKTENDIKKQLYIYFILHQQLLDRPFWNGGDNFAKWWESHECYNIYKSIFTNKYIFQKYNKAWQYSKGYNQEYGIWVQHNYDSYRNYFNELLNWAK